VWHFPALLVRRCPNIFVVIFPQNLLWSLLCRLAIYSSEIILVDNFLGHSLSRMWILLRIFVLIFADDAFSLSVSGSLCGISFKNKFSICCVYIFVNYNNFLVFLSTYAMRNVQPREWRKGQECLKGVCVHVCAEDFFRNPSKPLNLAWQDLSYEARDMSHWTHELR
jgi:hypothetical protein